MTPTIYDVASEAGVSPATVSRYLNPKGQYLSEQAKKRIEEAIAKLNFFRNESARLMRRKKTFQLGLVTFSSAEIFNSHYHAHILTGIVDTIRDTEYNLKIIQLENRYYRDIPQIFQDHGVDGMFVLTWCSHPVLVRLMETCSKNLPVMVFNDYVPTSEMNFVYSDVGQGVETAVDYLVAKGRTKIGFLKGPTSVRFEESSLVFQIQPRDAQAKYEGFLDAMTRHGLRVRETWVRECQTYSMTSGFEEASRILSLEELPEAIVCSNDETAIGVLNALRKRNVRCPEKVSVIGFDGIREGDLVMPSLTTVEQRLEYMGTQGCRSLIDLIEGTVLPTVHLKITPRLIERQSA